MMNGEHGGPPTRLVVALVVPAGRGKVEMAARPLIYPGNIDFHIYPDINTGNWPDPGFPQMSQHQPHTFTAFEGQRRLVSGPLPEVALAVKQAEQGGSDRIAIFSDATGRPIDLDLRGSEDEILARLPPGEAAPAAPSEPRGRGRPKLGVVAREVTLLPRHWEWLNAQPGGASVSLRKLVDAARRANGDKDRSRAARDAAYHFMSAAAGNLPNFEEASRALFADERRRLASLIAAWPGDIRDHIVRLAFGGDAVDPVNVNR
jgi:hypothetical protein